MLDKHQGPHRLLKMTDLTSRAALIEYYLSYPGPRPMQLGTDSLMTGEAGRCAGHDLSISRNRRQKLARTIG